MQNRDHTSRTTMRRRRAVAPGLGQNIAFGTKLSAQRRGFVACKIEIKLRERRCDDAGLSRQDLVRTLLWEQNFRHRVEDSEYLKPRTNLKAVKKLHRGFFACKIEIKLRERRCDDAGLSRQDLVRTLLWEQNFRHRVEDSEYLKPRTNLKAVKKLHSAVPKVRSKMHTALNRPCAHSSVSNAQNLSKNCTALCRKIVPKCTPL